MDKLILKENRIHGDFLFPISAYHNEIAPGRLVLECHWHDELEFLMVTSGKAVFQLDTCCYEVHEGEAIIVNSGELHAGYPIDGSSCIFDAIVFSGILLQSSTYDLIQSKYIEPFLKNNYSFTRHIKCIQSWEQEFVNRFKKTMSYLSGRKPCYELSVKSELYAMLSLLIDNSKPINSTPEINPDFQKTEKLKKAIKYIHENYSQKLSTMDLCQYLKISEGHFCRLFKQYFNKTPVEYLNYYRVMQAARLLEDTDMKVLEVAMEVGFDNLSYFIRTFKHFTNVTPSIYRSKYLK